MSAVTAKVIGSTIRSTAGMLPTATGKRRINSEVKVLVAQGALVIDQAASGEPVAQEALAGLVAQGALAELVVQVAQEALAELVVRVAQEALAELVVRVAPAGAELETVPAVVEQEPAPVGAEQGIAPVAAELEHVQEEVELELVRAAVLLRTKSVIAAHHRGLVPDPGAADLAAEVQTTREPAAAEAVIAWEVAVTVGAVVAADAAAVE